METKLKKKRESSILKSYFIRCPNDFTTRLNLSSLFSAKNKRSLFDFEFLLKVIL
ncbi:hypothetical protein FEM08_01030 [Flavobacterium gilvum]|nr:hypothetical protein FEM08_01030 [Flavobacterium gilvum]